MFALHDKTNQKEISLTMQALCPSPSLRAADIDALVIVRMKEVTIEEVGGTKERNPIAFFF